jgi:PKD repeat protein
MGMGENIGYGLIMTQNNPGGLYYASPTSITGRWIHNALLGDPTLRNDIVAPVSNLVATKAGFDCHLSWSASTESTIAGYNIYVKNDTNTSYVKLNLVPVSGTTYTDHCLEFPGTYTYMVRTLKLEINKSGSYYNMSEGISDTAFSSSGYHVVASFSTTVNGNTVQLTNTSTGIAAFNWNLGNGALSTSINPVATYSANGTYTISLISNNACDADTINATVNICHWLATASFSASVHGDTVSFVSTSQNADAYLFFFGNGQSSPTASTAMIYTPGTYTVKLVVSNICSKDSSSQVITVVDLGFGRENWVSKISVVPNPSSGKFKIGRPGDLRGMLSVYGLTGERVFQQTGELPPEIDLSQLAKGLYILIIEAEKGILQRKIVIE